MKNAMRFIDEQIAHQHITGKDMATRMGIDPASFSRFRAGILHDVNSTTLIKMQGGISDDPLVQAGFLCAYLRDRCKGPGAHHVEIGLSNESKNSGTVLKEEMTRKKSDSYDRLANLARAEVIDDKVINAFCELIKLVNKNRHLRSIIIEMAKIENSRAKQSEK